MRAYMWSIYLSIPTSSCLDFLVGWFRYGKSNPIPGFKVFSLNMKRMATWSIFYHHLCLVPPSSKNNVGSPSHGNPGQPPTGTATPSRSDRVNLPSPSVSLGKIIAILYIYICRVKYLCVISHVYIYIYMYNYPVYIYIHTHYTSMYIYVFKHSAFT